MTERLTAQERHALDALALATGYFSGLPDHHPSDAAEWEAGVHRLQEKVMARLAVRTHPETFAPHQENPRRAARPQSQGDPSLLRPPSDIVRAVVWVENRSNQPGLTDDDLAEFDHVLGILRGLVPARVLEAVGLRPQTVDNPGDKTALGLDAAVDSPPVVATFDGSGAVAYPEDPQDR